MKIKNEKLQFTINVEIACTEPESFKSQKNFQSEDAAAMKKYLSERIKEALADNWQYAAKVERVTIKPAKFLNEAA